MTRSDHLVRPSTTRLGQVRRPQPDLAAEARLAASRRANLMFVTSSTLVYHNDPPPPCLLSGLVNRRSKGGRKKKRAAPWDGPQPVTSLDFVEAFPADRPLRAILRRVYASPPRWLGDSRVRSRGHTSTSWYLHCPYSKSPTPDHLLSAVSRNLSDGTGRTSAKRDWPAPMADLAASGFAEGPPHFLDDLGN